MRRRLVTTSDRHPSTPTHGTAMDLWPSKVIDLPRNRRSAWSACAAAPPRSPIPGSSFLDTADPPESHREVLLLEAELGYKRLDILTQIPNVHGEKSDMTTCHSLS